jgi:dihydroorotase
MSNTFDLLLTGGTVLNPASSVRQALDLGITDGRIAAIQSKLPQENAKKILDVRNCYITPGLIDFHVHSYWGVNPYGCELDALCMSTGVTTAIDAGSSGPINFKGFKKLVYEPSKTRMIAFIALAQHGVLNDPGESPDVGVGIKVRLHKKGVGENGREALRLAIRAGEASKSPVMVHVGNTGISMSEIADTLRRGDVITHCYTPQKPSIIDEQGKLLPEVRKAKERGVIFDVGHAGGHFDFNLVRRAMGEGIVPDIISSDLHGRLSQPGFGVVGDLPTVLTKFLALGLNLDQIIAMCTINPAAVIGWQDRLGSLEVGRDADVAILQIVNEPTELRDSVGGQMTSDQRIAARWTIRAGEIFQASC